MKRLLRSHLPQNLCNISRIRYHFSYHTPFYINYRKYHKFYIPNMKKINIQNIKKYNTDNTDDDISYFGLFTMIFMWYMACILILDC